MLLEKLSTCTDLHTSAVANGRLVIAAIFPRLQIDLGCSWSSPMANFTLRVNGTAKTVDVAADTPLLWVLRDRLGLTGTKFGCGAGYCGACGVHVNGALTRSCTMPVSQAAGKNITTIEGLGANGLHALQKAWIAEDVPQFGYCQSGQIMAAAALLKQNPKPTDADIDTAMRGNICRCGTYQRIRQAIKQAAEVKR